MKIEIGSAEYIAIHHWLKFNFGIASKCENLTCSYKNPKRFEWALKKGFVYARSRESFAQLCKSCHIKYDWKKDTSLKIAKINKGRINAAKQIIQKELSGKIIKSWKSMTEVTRKVGILQSSISNMLAGRSKSAGGYVWELQK
jgi:hypothetical protein